MAYLSTSADLIQRTYRFLREASATPTKWPSAQVVDYLDEGHSYLCADLNYLQSQWYLNTSASIRDYPLPADMLVIRYVLHRGTPTDTQYRRLQQTDLIDAALEGRDFQSSGTASHWILAGVAGGQVIRLYPMPDASAASGIYIIGNQTPESIAISASPLPRHLLSLIPLCAAKLAWEDFSPAAGEAQRLEALYQTRLTRWRTLIPDMSPDNSTSRTWGDQQDDRPYTTLGTRRPIAPNPLNW